VGDKYSFNINGIGTHFLALNRSKKSVALNMRTGKGRTIFQELACKSDVIYDNFRPEVPKKMGADYETLSKLNPRIITCSISAFGESGPIADRGGYDPIGQAMGGGMSITTAPDGEPIRPGIPIADLGGGLLAVIGILAAIHARDVTGKGQKVTTSILGGQISFLIYMVTDYFASGESWGPSGVGKRLDACRHWYKCKDGEYVITAPRFTGASSEDWFVNLSKAIGREDLPVDPRFNTDQARSKNRLELLAVLNETYATKTVEEWEKILNAADVPCSRVNTIEKACNHPQVVHEGLVRTYPHPVKGDFKAPAPPIKFGNGERRPTAPPLMGQHTVEVLSDLLGYSREQLGALKKERIIDYP
jgi:crotonobetainyl-CoA:carnitine CoA-transferase CaiB-like acyl-CoA transferase